LNSWWFELADMAHKLLLSAIVPFLSPAAQMPFAMVGLEFAAW
jgi:hypothetical protein